MIDTHRSLRIVLCAAALAACAPPREDVTPQIRVVPGAAARALWIGGRGGPAAAMIPALPAAPLATESAPEAGTAIDEALATDGEPGPVAPSGDDGPHAGPRHVCDDDHGATGTPGR